MNYKILWVITIVGLYVIFAIPFSLITLILYAIIGLDVSVKSLTVLYTSIYLIWVIKSFIDISEE